MLAIVVLFFFLRHWTTTLVVATAIPFSLLAAASLMYFTGRTLNILSMMGLMLAVGMLVDNAVVVLEERAGLDIDWPAPLAEIDRRRYGDTAIAIARVGT